MSAALPNGGPAFPGVTVNDTERNLTDPFGTLLPPNAQATYSGMTLRDYFAAKAMQAMLPGAMLGAKPGASLDAVDTVTVAAYNVADRMLKARSA